MLKDELLGRKVGLTEQRVFTGTQAERRRAYDLWKKRQVMQEDYKDVMRLCSEKI